MERNDKPLPAAARGPAPCEDTVSELSPAAISSGTRYNGVLFPVIGERTRKTPKGPITESYDRLMWPAVAWATDNLIDYKIRYAVEAERKRCARMAEECIVDISMASDPDATYEIGIHNEVYEDIANRIRSSQGASDGAPLQAEKKGLK